MKHNFRAAYTIVGIFTALSTPVTGPYVLGLTQTSYQLYEQGLIGSPPAMGPPHLKKSGVFDEQNPYFKAGQRSALGLYYKR